MKKRLFATLLMLCLLVAALTATVAAEGSTDFSQLTYYDDDAKHQITFNFLAEYTCRLDVKWGGDAIVTAMPSSSYMAQGLNNWTSDQIVFNIRINQVSCKGREDGGDIHGTHKYSIVDPKIVTFSGSDLCHKPLNNLTAEVNSVVYGENDTLTFHVTTTEPRYTLTKHPQADPTCTEYGYTQTCYECPGCGKFFADQNAEQGLSDSVRRAMTPHDYVNGVCQVCGATGEAYTLSSSGKTYYTTVEAALAAAYDDPDNLSVWITHYEREADINLTNSCDVRVCNGVTIRNITSASDSQTAINIKITNHGTIKTIAPNSSGTQFWEITNHGRILEKSTFRITGR